MLLHSRWSPKLINGRGPSSFGISQKWRRARPRTLPGQSPLECVRLPQIYLTSTTLFNCTFSDSVPDGSLQWSSSCLVCVGVCVCLCVVGVWVSVRVRVSAWVYVCLRAGRSEMEIGSSLYILGGSLPFFQSCHICSRTRWTELLDVAQISILTQESCPSAWSSIPLWGRDFGRDQNLLQKRTLGKVNCTKIMLILKPWCHEARNDWSDLPRVAQVRSFTPGGESNARHFGSTDLFGMCSDRF